MTVLRFVATAAAAIGFAACEGWVADPETMPDQTAAMSGAGPMMSVTAADEAPPVDLATIMDNMNVALEAAGADYRAYIAEYITDGSGGEAGGTVLSKAVGNKQLPHDFVPFDPRRAGWSGPVDGANDNITYAIDQTGDAVPPLGGLTGGQTDAAIVRAQNTWQALTCSQLGLTRNVTTADLGLIAFLNGLGGSNVVAADVQHAGWRDINFAGGILGVTFTFVFVSGGALTDIDGNGLPDVAFREVYYDPSFNWRDNGVSNIDVETVSLHESGHGLSQAHFGTVAIKNDGTLKASPRAVMNALYSGPLRELLGTDNGGHCSNWASWPNK
jgi:hypothetical protein